MTTCPNCKAAVSDRNTIHINLVGKTLVVHYLCPKCRRYFTVRK